MDNNEYRWKRPTPDGPGSPNPNASSHDVYGNPCSNDQSPNGNGTRTQSGAPQNNGSDSSGSNYSATSRTEFKGFGNTHNKRARSPRNIRGLSRGKIIVLVLIVLAASLFFNSFYELQEDEYAVITTFGRPSVVSTSGLKFKLPLIQQKHIVSKATKGFPIGYDNYGKTVASESVMITVDYNFVNVDFYVEYRVTDPIKYLYNSEDPVGILKMLCQSYIRDTIGLYEVDDVITTGKSEIQSSIKEKILNRLEQEDIGITLVNITIQDAEPPTQEVQVAFKAVETAKQQADTAMNNANKYANEVLPAAKADADQILQQAEAYKAARINEATGQSSRFSQLYEEYSRFPEITRQRLFYETISDIFPDMKIVILGNDGTEVQTVLPLDDFTGTDTNS